MGFKNLKEHYRIKHIVQVTDAGICIGSPWLRWRNLNRAILPDVQRRLGRRSGVGEETGAVGCRSQRGASMTVAALHKEVADLRRIVNGLIRGKKIGGHYCACGICTTCRRRAYHKERYINRKIEQAKGA